MEIQYKYEPENQRVAAYDGDKVIGEINYQEEDKYTWIVNHTGVDPEYQGRSVAGLLLDNLVDQARQRDVKVKSACSYVTSKFMKSPKYADIQG